MSNSIKNQQIIKDINLMKLTKRHRGYKEMKEVVEFLDQNLFETKDYSDKVSIKELKEVILTSLGYSITSNLLNDVLKLEMGIQSSRAARGLVIEGFKTQAEANCYKFNIRLHPDNLHELTEISLSEGFKSPQHLVLRLIKGYVSEYREKRVGRFRSAASEESINKTELLRLERRKKFESI